MMHRSLLRSWTLVGLLLLLTSLAQADDLERHADLLRTATDFRVRTQAALSLGASRSKRAVVPLCQGVGDEHRVVRIAAATALSRLALGGSTCLENRLKQESDEKVKAALQKALDRLAGPSVPEPAISRATKFYVAIDKLSGPERLNGVVRTAFVKGIGGTATVAVAPAGETVSQAEKVLRTYPAAKGFLLSATAPKPVYADGELRVKLSIAIMTYPDRAIVGTFTQRLAMPGVSGQDEQAEQELLVAAAESAMRKFLQLAPTLDP